jgi:hypothetical protein
MLLLLLLLPRRGCVWGVGGFARGGDEPAGVPVLVEEQPASARPGLMRALSQYVGRAALDVVRQDHRLGREGAAEALPCQEVLGRGQPGHRWLEHDVDGDGRGRVGPRRGRSRCHVRDWGPVGDRGRRGRV